ncbi:MAG TPA: hypothetical protein VM802_21485 [Chitinophaga sp.]|uniref:hypothetical protein n=1 Tax=Chitinophaga sp. TaxID=1869181 RepID=UPI002BFFF510|nr:hypothetical protein [Chitinophaga sp.]HVI47460.1 hypothetical protein [Chitinophaga sp.]
MAEEKENEITLPLRSTEIQELIGRPPHWLVRSGTGAFFLLSLLLFTVSWIVRYPETIEYPLKLNLAASPQVITMPASDSTFKVLVQDGEKVTKGQILAWTGNEKHQLTASIDGNASFAVPSENMVSSAVGTPLLYIMPATYNPFGIMHISPDDIIKIRKGQQALVKIAGENFTIPARVVLINNVLTDSSYQVWLSFPSGLKDDAGKPLLIREGMTATGRIIIANKRLLEKMF